MQNATSLAKMENCRWDPAKTQTIPVRYDRSQTITKHLWFTCQPLKHVRNLQKRLRSHLWRSAAYTVGCQRWEMFSLIRKKETKNVQGENHEHTLLDLSAMADSAVTQMVWTRVRWKSARFECVVSCVRHAIKQRLCTPIHHVFFFASVLFTHFAKPVLSFTSGAGH